MMNGMELSKAGNGLALLCCALLTATIAGADEDAGSQRFFGFAEWGAAVCPRSADRMLKACLFDAGDDQQTLLANCLNLADAADRQACRQAAHASRREDLDECFDVHEARRDACDLLQEDRYPDPLESYAINFVDPDAIVQPNPYLSLRAGHTYVLRAGEEGEETVVVHVTDESREILGVPCRIVKDLVFEEEDGEYTLVEYTDDWFAQDDLGNVYYCGEIARNYEDGILRNLDGSFEAGLDFAKAGDLIRAMPIPGAAHRQEYALGEAEDIAQYVAVGVDVPESEGGGNESYPCSGACLKTLEFSPLSPGDSEFKYYLPGTGFVLAVAMEDGEVSGEREELVCVGDSLGILDDCGLSDAEALAEQLCEIDSASLCAD